jgi:hypothetical protein
MLNHSNLFVSILCMRDLPYFLSLPYLGLELLKISCGYKYFLYFVVPSTYFSISRKLI